MVLKTISTDWRLGIDYTEQMTNLFEKHGITKNNLVDITAFGSLIYITYDDSK